MSRLLPQLEKQHITYMAKQFTEHSTFQEIKKMEYRQLSWDNLNTLCKQFSWNSVGIDEFSMIGNHML